MITKAQKQQVLLNIYSKEEKMKISSIIDKANRSQIMSKVIATCFLDLNEKSIITSILNREKIKYITYFPNEYCEKCIIVFLPDFIDEANVDFSNFISCIKIKAKDLPNLRHKDFMGSIYSLGIKNEFIGDIFLSDEGCFVYVSNSIEKFILDNLFKVANQEVECESIPIDSKEAKNLKIEYNTKSYIIPSRRIDALLAEVYSLSRKEAKDKIVAGDLYINAKICINPAQNFNEQDIVSFRKCGKFKVGEELRKTKSGNICIDINRYK